MSDKDKLELIDYLTTNIDNYKGSSYLDITINMLVKAIEPRTYFNLDKFKTWFKAKNISFMNNPLGFLQKCGVADIERGCFDDKFVASPAQVSISTITLFNAMRENNIEILKNDDIFIGIVEAYILKNELMPLTELIRWNRKAINYLKNKKATSKDFIYLFHNTRDMRNLKISWTEIENEYNDEIIAWEDLTAATVEFMEESETENGKDYN